LIEERTSDSVPEKLYIDTNVLIHYTFSRQNRYFHKRAKKLVDAIERGNYKGIVSNLTLMEFLIVLKRSLLMESQNHEHDKIMSKAREKVGNVFRLKNVDIVKDANDGPWLFESLTNALSILRRHPGSITLTRGCYRFKALGVSDAIHVILATGLGCERIATFDTSFRDTSELLPPLLVHRDPI
jgi:predicted nucleic acid-binding protein